MKFWALLPTSEAFGKTRIVQMGSRGGEDQEGSPCITCRSTVLATYQVLNKCDIVVISLVSAHLLTAGYVHSRLKQCCLYHWL